MRGGLRGAEFGWLHKQAEPRLALLAFFMGELCCVPGEAKMNRKQEKGREGGREYACCKHQVEVAGLPC